MRPHKPQKEKKKGLVGTEILLRNVATESTYSCKLLKFPEQCGLTLVETTTTGENYFKPSFQVFFFPPASCYCFTLVL